MSVEWAGVGLGAAAVVGAIGNWLLARRANTIAQQALEETRKAAVIALYWEWKSPNLGLVVENVGRGPATDVIGVLMQPNELTAINETESAWKYPGLAAGKEREIGDGSAIKLDPGPEIPPRPPLPAQPACAPPLLLSPRLALVGWTNADGTWEWGTWRWVPRR